MSNEDAIWVGSLVSHRTRQPIVEIRWGDKRAQLTAEDAAAHAFAVLQAAEAAQTDAFLLEFATKRMQISDAGAAQLITDFRNYRRAMSGREKVQP